jgi:hypothetical protein
MRLHRSLSCKEAERRRSVMDLGTHCDMRAHPTTEQR